MKRIYFDNAASAPLNKKVIKYIKKYTKQTLIHGNPSSLHTEGRIEKQQIEIARKKCAQALGCHPDEIFFTSGASESNTWAHLIWQLECDTRVHDSLKQMYLLNIKNNQARAVSFINNETGHEDLFDYFIEKNRPFGTQRMFVDLTSAVGHYNINLHNMPFIVGASLSGHKIGALQGVGLLYVRKDEQNNILPLITGHQENGMRGGTENTLGIISLGITIEDIAYNISKYTKHIDKCMNYIYNELSKYNVNISMRNHIMNITFKDLRATTAVAIYDNYGIAVSAGSACNSDSDEPSVILLAEGYDKESALNTIRISLSEHNTIKECHRFIRASKKVLDNY